MARALVSSLAVSCVAGSRMSISKHTNRHEMQWNETHPPPIPMPDGYDFRFHGWCYGATEPSAPVPSGYRKAAGMKCPGQHIRVWGHGSSSATSSAYGDESFQDALECAKTCNEHDECAGFEAVNGVCSHWQSGELQDLPGVPAAGHDCYVQWEVTDLSGASGADEEKIFKPNPPNSIKPKGPQVSDCLCVWDIDRTLTAKQGWTDCPGTVNRPDVVDHAYNGGTLIVSDLTKNINQTHCGKCYFAAVSAGTASGQGSEVRDFLDTIVDKKYNVGDWVDGCPTPVWGTKVMCCGEGEEKLGAVRDIVGWLAKQGVNIENDKVHFYDDKQVNVDGFRGGPFNAYQVSCASRDGARGGCGGTAAEVLDTPGIHVC